MATLPYILKVTTTTRNFKFVAPTISQKSFSLLHPLVGCCTGIKHSLRLSRDGYQLFGTVNFEIGSIVPEITTTNKQTHKCFFFTTLVQIQY